MFLQSTSLGRTDISHAWMYDSAKRIYSLFIAQLALFKEAKQGQALYMCLQIPNSKNNHDVTPNMKAMING